MGGPTPHRESGVAIEGSLKLRAALVALTVVVAYANGLGGPFQFDDWNVIVDNPRVHDWAAWWASMPGIRPLLKATWVANWTTADTLGGRAFAMHATNVAIHVGNVVLVLVLGAHWLRERGLDRAHALRAATLAAALFALHPAQTEAVTYVSGRSVSLMAMAMLVALGAQTFAHDATRRARSVAWHVVAAIAYLAALAVKEHAWTLPFAALLLERSRPGTTWAQAWRRTALLWSVTAAALVAVFATPAYWRLLGAVLAIRPLGTNLLTQIDGQWYLLVDVALGLHTNLDPDLPVHRAWGGALAAKAGVMVLVFALAASRWRSRRWLAFGAVWIAIHLLATNTVLPRLDVANDRQLYLALAGLAWIVAVPLTARRRPGLEAALAIAVVATLAVATVRRNADYATEVSLWEATAATSPGKPRVWNNLGFAYHAAGRRGEARAAYTRAIALDPDDPRPRVNLQLVEDGLGPSLR